MPEAEALTPSQPAPAAPPAPSPAEGGEPAAQNTAEQAPAPQPGSETKPDTDQDPEKQRGTRRFERRLDKAYRRAAEAEARRDLAEKQLAELRAKSAPAEDPSAPRLESFKDIEEYAAARAKHAADNTLKEHTATQRADAAKRAQAKLAEDWEGKAARGGEKYDDFDEVVGELKPIAPWAVALMEAENGEEIAYFLGKNLKDIQRIASLSPTAQIREIGKLEAKLAAEPPKPKTPSKAPAPINPVTGTAPRATDVPSEEDDMGAWFKKRQKQVHGSKVR